MLRRTLPRLIGTALFGIAALMPASASAQVIFNNGAPDNYDGLNVTGGFTTADDFGFNGCGNKAVDLWIGGATLAPTVTGSFFWQILTDDAGAPGGSVLASGNVSNATGTLTDNSFFQFNSYLFTANLGTLCMGSGTYWLSIGGFNSESDPGLWYWATSDGHNGNSVQNEDGGQWYENGTEQAFVIYAGGGQIATTPEPGTFVLMASGLAGVAGAYRRRRSRSRA